MKSMRWISLTFLFVTEFVVAQNDVSEPNIIPPSPRSAEFNKYIDYKVSIENGLPVITLDFYEIKIDDVTVPIGITYHASGIKFGQTKGDVGLGWQLNPGYRISRTIMNRPDEFYTKPDFGSNLSSYLNSLFATKLERDTYLSRFLKIAPFFEPPYIIPNAATHLDGGMDIFTFGLPGADGKFVISDRANKIITPLQATPLKINYTQTDNGISEFNVTDGNGIKYKLGQGVESADRWSIWYNGAPRKYNTGWMLSELNTPLGNTVNFNYQPFSEYLPAMPTSSRSFRHGGYSSHCSNGACSCIVCSDCNPPVHFNNCYASMDEREESPGVSSYYHTLILSGISTPHENVTLARNTSGTINAILITNKNGVQLKKVNFYYSANATFLDSISVAGNDNEAIQKYRFEYYDRDVNKRYYDCFGYYQSEPAYTDGYLAPKIEFPIQQMTTSCGISSQTYTFGRDKKNLPTTPVYTLKKITYPTGGSVNYVFESNQYADGSGNVIRGGGLRVAKITSNDLVAPLGTTMERRYYYGSTGVGVAIFDPTNPAYYMKERIELVPGAGGSSVALRKLVHSSLLYGELASSYLHTNYGWYPMVKESYVGSGTTTGFIEYTFIRPGTGSMIQPCPPHNLEYPSYLIRSYDFWSKSYLKTKAIYAWENESDVLKQKEEFEYNEPGVSPNISFLNLSVSPYALRGKVVDATNNQTTYAACPFPYESSSLNSLLNYGAYKITAGNVVLRKKTSTTYANGIENKEVTEIDYTLYNLPASERKQINNGEILATNYKYPFSYSGLTGTDEITSGVKNLGELNIVNHPVEQTTYRSNIDGSNSRLVSSTFSAYRNDLPLRTKVLSIENPLGTPNFVPSFVESGIIKNDARYKEQLLYNQYDTRGNILEWQKKNDIREVYIWGYKAQYPVAKIIGTDYNTARTYINQSVLDNAIGGIDDANIRSHLNNLRNIPGAIVTTYTYIPLVGITSETDPRGRTTFFEYDNFNRLMHVKDKDNNILKKFDYKYQATILQ